jgi:hypothetical protein
MRTSQSNIRETPAHPEGPVELRTGSPQIPGIAEIGERLLS